MPDPSLLVDFSIVVGNDFTGPLMDDLQSELDLVPPPWDMGKQHRMDYYAKWVTDDQTFENQKLSAICTEQVVSS